MDERRSAPRYTLDNQTWLAVNSFGGEELGQVVNISLTGFMLVTKHEMEIGDVFQFQLTSQGKKTFAFKLGASCLWCSPAVTAGHYWAGFQIIDIAEQAQVELEGLLNDLSD